ncbi:MAG: putative transposase [Pseudobdellovibrio sp.]|jgi:hypothetical protein|nr:putative transposase [Pseudobdellovibrio sp.]
MRKGSLLSFKSLFLAAVVAWPFMAANAQSQMSVGTSVYNPKSSKSTDFGATLGLSLKQISYGSASVYDNGSLQQVETEITLSKQGRFFSNSNLILGTFSLENSFYFALPEAYGGYGSKENSLTVGRKIENYSISDQFFNFGLMHPTFSNDNINFRQNGLTGIGFHHHEGSFGFNVAYNPLFIPNQGPQVKIEDGQVNSTNRWATVPPEAVRLGDENREIVYAIRDYKISDVVNNPGYMANIFFGEKKERPYLMATYGRKPINEIALSRDTFADIATYRGNVILNPHVLYHQIYAADVNVDSSDVKFTLSFLGDQPENIPAENMETMQTLSPLSIVSAYLAYDMNGTFGRKIELYVAAANITGGEIRDLNSSGQGSEINFASARTLFKRPLKTGVKGELFYIQNRPFSADVNYTYDQQLKGSLLSAAIRYAMTKTIHISAAADVLGVQNESTTESNFLQQNKANDRIMAGVDYVF